MIERCWKRFLRRSGMSPWGLLGPPLWLASLLYRFVPGLHRRLTKERVRLSVPVIAVGNITVGGTGKTPMVHLLARRLIDEGFRIGIVSAGWGRAGDEPILDEGTGLQDRSADDVGDEVLLLAHLVPQAVFSIHPSKSEGARRLAACGERLDAVIVDDAFQHYRLARDLDLVTYDAALPARVLRPFPYGVMREPRSALRRADIVVITRANFARDIGRLSRRLCKISPRAAHYTAQFSISGLVGAERRYPVKYLEDKSVFLFAGVGNFEPLRRQVSVLAGDLDAALELSDHQRYDAATLARIKRLADRHDSDVIVTTGKDWVKIRHFDFGRELYYLAQSVDLDPGEEQLIAAIEDRLNLRKAGH
ncbi:MAG TPA: tetraacyldisaccharide 4'-kinase [candidate division Zixibacteria bacterium]|nr:tetraacyldisaccharide 4'-kinase [candidate division Zixibacteria bacterium]MDD4916290.1 tetraacyldisaccharide 4'-kinase [candidate division Zixibacteria bacterium]MDM7973671.1 tetraacyldisaccharide 4'-kinase [candidate division Zixibacteria bacterium]HOD65729.1 tetraacyldisaccharide 4'-kinase [candidate division Zixibacteria bacterium]HOZ08291.1 tetraacyldisaccharide 4'-kinase [candidate division Zixibacteria bacterium]